MCVNDSPSRFPLPLLHLQDRYMNLYGDRIDLIYNYSAVYMNTTFVYKLNTTTDSSMKYLFEQAHFIETLIDI